MPAPPGITDLAVHIKWPIFPQEEKFSLFSSEIFEMKNFKCGGLQHDEVLGQLEQDETKSEPIESLLSISLFRNVVSMLSLGLESEINLKMAQISNMATLLEFNETQIAALSLKRGPLIRLRAWLLSIHIDDLTPNVTLNV
jgi:hypothetical protein